MEKFMIFQHYIQQVQQVVTFLPLYLGLQLLIDILHKFFTLREFY